MLRQWTLYPRNTPRTAIVQFKPISPQALDAYFQQMIERYDNFHRLFSDQDKMQVVYEDLCNNYESVMRDIQGFLNVPEVSLSPSTRKHPSYSLRETITNYDELKAYYSGSKWAEFFDE